MLDEVVDEPAFRPDERESIVDERVVKQWIIPPRGTGSLRARWIG